MANGGPASALTCGGSNLSAAHGPQHSRTAGVAMAVLDPVSPPSHQYHYSLPPHHHLGVTSLLHSLCHTIRPPLGVAMPDPLRVFRTLLHNTSRLFPSVSSGLSWMWCCPGLPGWYQVVPDEGGTFPEWMEPPAQHRLLVEVCGSQAHSQHRKRSLSRTVYGLPPRLEDVLLYIYTGKLPSKSIRKCS